MADVADRIEPAFARALGSDAVTVDADGVLALGVEVPTVRVAPHSVEQVADALRIAREHDAVVVPTGSGSALSLGNLPRGDVVLLSTGKLDKTLDYEPRDLTAIVEAGKTLASIQEETAAEHQMLALDPPNRASTSVGGLVATNASGPLRQAYGTPRDLCLGTTVVLSDGAVVKCGGRVVKNVAGYDTTRLYVGSMGTLGVVVDASFRLHPVPEKTAVVVGVGADWADAVDLARRVVEGRVEPRFVELLDLGDAHWVVEGVDGLAPAVVVGFGGSEAQVEHQVERTSEALASAGASDVRVDE
ncbi:FAD-binding oxidoreductase, partial [Candidatus Poribacteria bacterium]|nr:FAD-binding oxidoreductase [Candidatus Poribacteria bacterium]